ncbi:copper chaperone PCu(A)C [Campylobacter sp.]|uniref:copper chaperone PCu(A)C n=1 Tax=Campylobacter sp. TaxID=205 RepID=UPI0025C349A0|nr:copper chaperone PCu(A)C [Campylobacter sp.]
MKKILAICALGSYIFANNIIVNDPYVRQTPPNAKSTAFFLELTNKSNNDIALIKAESSLSNTTEIHDHIMENGKKMMMQVPKIIIKANSSTALKPGGKHIMALNLNQNVTENTKADLTLYFDDNSTITLKDIHSKHITK